MLERVFGKRTRQVSFRRALDRLRVSFWFTPLVMAVFAVLLAEILNVIDAGIPNMLLETRRIVLSGDPEEIRSILIGMATTTLATAGIVFALLTLPLSTVAAQFGSRLLRIFLRDRTTQIVLGMFVATFFYCLTAALLIPPDGDQGEAPQLTVTVALALFLATFASLIALIQHITTALQAPNIVAGAASELTSVIHSYEKEDGEGGAGFHAAASISEQEFREEDGYIIRARDTGYIQSVDPDQILRLAEEADLVLRLVRKPGKFVSPGEKIALAWPAGNVDPQIAYRLRHSFAFGQQRTPTQDIEYAVNQLVEVAVRAMSPAINDPFTAMTCLDYLGAGLALFVEQGDPPSHYYDSEGKVRLLFEPSSFAELLDATFTMLRHTSRENAAVLARMLDAIEAISLKAGGDGQSRELLRHVELILAESENSSLVEADKLATRRRCEGLVDTLRKPFADP